MTQLRDGFEQFPGKVTQPAKPRYTPARTSTPNKGEHAAASPTIASHIKAQNKRIAQNAAAVKAAHRDDRLEDKTAGNGVDRGAIGV